jgi:peptide chain release factor 3
MDPRHRDRIAFLRVCSGKFMRDMTVTHGRTGKKVRLSSAHKLFAQERETVDEAYAGDVIGLVGHSEFGIGDTLTDDPTIAYREIPRFPPECFAFLHNPNPSKFKQFRQGLEQLLQEGVMQVFDLQDQLQKIRYSLRSGHCSSRSCNIAWRVSTAPSRAWRLPRGLPSNGCHLRPTQSP